MRREPCVPPLLQASGLARQPRRHRCDAYHATWGRACRKACEIQARIREGRFRIKSEAFAQLAQTQAAAVVNAHAVAVTDVGVVIDAVSKEPAYISKVQLGFLK